MTKDHSLRQIKLCQDAATKALTGIQASVMAKQDVKGTIKLSEKGKLDADCVNLKINEGDYIQTLVIGYSQSKVLYLSFVTKDGVKETRGDKSGIT